MNAPRKCYICNNRTVEIHQNIFKLKSLHSQTPIEQFCKKFHSANAVIRPRDGSETCAVCYACMDKINEYDAACRTVLRIEYQFKTTFQRTETYYNVMRSEQTKQGPIATQSKPDESDTEDIFGDIEAISVDENTSDSDLDDVELTESDNSFEWPEENSKRKIRTKPTWLPYYCRACPAEYRTKRELLVTYLAPFSFLYCTNCTFNSISMVIYRFTECHIKWALPDAKYAIFDTS